MWLEIGVSLSGLGVAVAAVVAMRTARRDVVSDARDAGRRESKLDAALSALGRVEEKCDRSLILHSSNAADIEQLKEVTARNTSDIKRLLRGSRPDWGGNGEGQ